MCHGCNNMLSWLEVHADLVWVSVLKMERGVGLKKKEKEKKEATVKRSLVVWLLFEAPRCLLSWMLLVHQPRHLSLPLQTLTGKWCGREHFDKAEVAVVFSVLLCVKYTYLCLSFNQAPVAQKP